jgi:hypothetical protein
MARCPSELRGGRARHRGLPAIALGLAILVIIASAPVPAGAETTVTRPGGGTWSVDPAGRVTATGGAPWYGDAGHIDLWQPIVGIASTVSGRGYWLAARDSGVFSYGNAAFHGNLISQLIARDHLPPGTLTGANILDYLHGEIVDIASTGDGYYLLGKDGGVFSFGRLPFHGSMSGRLASAAVDLRMVQGGYVITEASGLEWVCRGDACSTGGTLPPRTCSPHYTPCIPPFPPDLDCSDIGHPVAVIGDDPHDLDADGDGIACDAP